MGSGKSSGKQSGKYNTQAARSKIEKRNTNPWDRKLGFRVYENTNCMCALYVSACLHVCFVCVFLQALCEELKIVRYGTL